MRWFTRLCRVFENFIHPFTEPGQKLPPAKFHDFVVYFSSVSRGWFVVLTVMTALVAVSELLIFYCLGALVNWMGESTPDKLLDDYGLQLAGLVIFSVVVMPAIMLIHTLVVRQTLHDNLPLHFRWIAFSTLINQSVAFFQDESTGQLAQKISQSATAMRNLLVQISQTFTYVTSYFVGMCIVALSTNPVLLIPTLVWAGLYVWIIYLFIPRLRSISMKQADAAAKITGVMGDVFANMQTVKLYSSVPHEREYLGKELEAYKYISHEQSRIASLLYFSLQMINALLLFFISLTAIYAWLQSTASVGAVAVMISLALRLRAISQSILWEVSAFLENVGTVEAAIPLLSQEPTVKDDPSMISLLSVKGQINFNNVSFCYQPSIPVIKNLTLHIKPGEKVGLVGRSGSGKSTLISLLLRFYDPQKGSISIDGLDIRGVTQTSLRRHLSVVTQDTALLHRSVRDNIIYHSTEQDFEVISQALRFASATEFIGHLDDGDGRGGYDYIIGERGGKLSGGQRQRLAIARALLKDASVFILDEATSALDAETENLIQDNLSGLLGNKTVIAIAHRLSTLSMLDRIIVLDEGRIVESGTHEALLKKNGIYATLWRHQSDGFLGVQ